MNVIDDIAVALEGKVDVIDDIAVVLEGKANAIDDIAVALEVNATASSMDNAPTFTGRGRRRPRFEVAKTVLPGRSIPAWGYPALPSDSNETSI